LNQYFCRISKNPLKCSNTNPNKHLNKYFITKLGILMNITKSLPWQKLQQHHQLIANKHMRELFAENPQRFDQFSLTAADLFLDYSKNRITAETMQLLVGLAKEVNLTDHIEAMFTGQIINKTEQRAVLHTALRSPKHDIPEIKETLQKMLACAENIRNGKWRGYSGKEITDVVNIGIGGSDLGPAMVTEALIPYNNSNLKCHFVSNIDATHISETLRYLNPETTLFIIASKTFTTQETLCNATTAREWLEQKAQTKNAVAKHMLAVSAKPERAADFGIDANNVYPFWDWVGGRFSLWGAIGFAIAIAIGAENFQQLLAGAHAMDHHFRHTKFANNLPVILALLDIWYVNFFNTTTHAILPYDQYMHLLPAYLQQLEMESNGKRVQIDGTPVDYATSSVIWGAVGTNGQHAFHQLLMQGTQLIPVDFIIPRQSHNPIGQHHLLLFANCLAQSQALMQGRNAEEVRTELTAQGMETNQIEKLIPHKIIPGNVPSNTILVDKITPFTLGALIAAYEHKVFTAGIIWNINSFDQWGVELGKQMANKIVPNLEGDKKSKNMDSSTLGLIEKFS
jgi:glucose-6-phosphate isomerase